MEEDSYDLTVDGDIFVKISSLMYSCCYKYDQCYDQVNEQVDVNEVLKRPEKEVAKFITTIKNTAVANLQYSK